LIFLESVINEHQEELEWQHKEICKFVNYSTVHVVFLVCHKMVLILMYTKSTPVKIIDKRIYSKNRYLMSANYYWIQLSLMAMGSHHHYADFVH